LEILIDDPTLSTRSLIIHRLVHAAPRLNNIRALISCAHPCEEIPNSGCSCLAPRFTTIAYSISNTRASLKYPSTMSSQAGPRELSPKVTSGWCFLVQIGAWAIRTSGDRSHSQQRRRNSVSNTNPNQMVLPTRAKRGCALPLELMSNTSS
jgi:hypothetical protein